MAPRGQFLTYKVPGEITRVKLERHLFPADEHVEDMKCDSAGKTNLRTE